MAISDFLKDVNLSHLIDQTLLCFIPPAPTLSANDAFSFVLRRDRGRLLRWYIRSRKGKQR